jgi:nicotinamidase-related amidase
VGGVSRDGTGFAIKAARHHDHRVLCGIATNIGVESTARFAFEYGFNQIFVEDAMSALSVEEHTFTISKIFPRIGLVRKTKELLTEILPV